MIQHIVLESADFSTGL